MKILITVKAEEQDTTVYPWLGMSQLLALLAIT